MSDFDQDNQPSTDAESERESQTSTGVQEEEDYVVDINELNEELLGQLILQTAADGEWEDADEWTDDDEEDEEDSAEGGDLPPTKWVVGVPAYSTFYGRSSNASYSVGALCGIPRVYPQFTDSSASYVPRHYGRDHGFAEDFLVLRFARKVLPRRLEIYETFFCGAVIAVYAQDESEKFVPLWRGLPAGPADLPRAARIFRPPLREVDFSTSVICLLLDSSTQWYYPEIDAVMLDGPTSLKEEAEIKRLAMAASVTQVDDPRQPSPAAQSSPDSDDQPAAAQSSPDSDGQPAAGVTRVRSDHVGGSEGIMVLHESILAYLFAFVPLPLRLGRLLTASRLFRTVAWQSLQDPDGCVDLRPLFLGLRDSHLNLVWHHIHAPASLSLAWCFLLTSDAPLPRPNQLQTLHSLSLDAMSWSSLEMGPDASWVRDLTAMAPRLQRISLTFAGGIDDLLHNLVENCPHLHSVSLNHARIGDQGLAVLETIAPNLTTLDLCRSESIRSQPLRALLSKCSNLVQLQLNMVHATDDGVMETISLSCPKLEWLDVGWNELINPDGLISVARRCTRLRRLYLLCVRTVDNAVLQTIGEHLSELTHLDLMGTRGSWMLEVLTETLGKLHKLQFLDIFFNARVEADATERLRELFPHVDIKGPGTMADGPLPFANEGLE